MALKRQENQNTFSVASDQEYKRFNLSPSGLDSCTEWRTIVYFDLKFPNNNEALCL